MEQKKREKGFLIVDGDFKIVSSNETFREWYPQTALGKICYKTFFGFNSPCPNCRIVSGNYEDKIMLNPNTGKWVNSVMEPVEVQKKGECFSIEVSNIVQDNDVDVVPNDKSVLAENQHLMEINSLWNTALNNMPNGYHRCANDECLTLLSVSERFCNILGYSREELVSLFDNKYINLVHPDDLEQFHSFVNKVNTNGEDSYVQWVYRIKGKAGYIWVLDTTKFVPGSDKCPGCSDSVVIHGFGDGYNSLSSCGWGKGENCGAKSCGAFYQGAITDVSNIMGLHQKEKEKLLNTTNKINQYKKALVSGANVIYEVNVTKDILEVVNFYRGDKEIPVSDILDKSIPCAYSEYLPYIAERVAEDDRAIFYETNSINYFKRCFAQGVLKWQLEYGTLSVEKKHIHMRKHYILTENEITGDIHALIVAKDLTKEDQVRKENEYNLKVQKRELANALYKAEQRLKVIDGLCSEYHIVFYVDVKKDMCIPYVLPENERKRYNIGEFQETPFSRLIIRYITRNTTKEERREIFKKAAMNVVLDELEDKDTYQINYRLKQGNNIDHSQVRIVKIDDNKYEQVWAFRSIEHIVQEERKQQKILQDLLVKTRKAEQAKTTFLLNMSHDIRTPMNAIIGFNNIAKENLDNREEALNALMKTDIASHHLLNLINEVLEMARIESNKVEIHTQIVCAKDYFSQIEEMFSLSMKEKDITFTTEYCCSTPYIYLDVTRVMQVITNLLGNAMKFTKSGGKIKYSVKEIEKNNDYVIYEIIVSDTGIGMSPEFQKKLFNAFEREENPTTSHVVGTGLGLSISKNIATMLGGSLTCVSQQGKGSEFSFKFKSDIATNTEEINKFKSQDLNTKAENMDYSDKRILIVEDNELNLEIAVKVLSRYGFNIETACNGAEAVEMVKKSKAGYYDVVLMDIQMPVMDGYTATKKIRNLKNKDLASVPIIAMTANAFEEDRQKAIDIGMNGHLSKPINLSKLLSMLDKW